MGSCLVLDPFIHWKGKKGSTGRAEAGWQGGAGPGGEPAADTVRWRQGMLRKLNTVLSICLSSSFQAPSFLTWKMKGRSGRPGLCRAESASKYTGVLSHFTGKALLLPESHLPAAQSVRRKRRKGSEWTRISKGRGARANTPCPGRLRGPSGLLGGRGLGLGPGAETEAVLTSEKKESQTENEMHPGEQLLGLENLNTALRWE